MGRVVTSINSTIDISESSRQTQNDFSEEVGSVQIGPVSNLNPSGDNISVNNPTISQINRWIVMSTADEGLKNALYDWINTTKDGVRMAPNILNGRTKKLTFNFYGNIGKSIMPGELGEFNLVFSYSPQAVSTQTNNNNNL